MTPPAKIVDWKFVLVVIGLFVCLAIGAVLDGFALTH